MSINYRNFPGSLTLIASIGMMPLPSNAGAQPAFNFNNPPVIPVTRQVSNVDWGNWQRASDAYEGRYGKAYSVGAVTFFPTSSTYFVIFQVRNTSPVTVNAKCEVKAASSGRVVYSLDQRLKPGQASDLDGAGDMYTSEPGERYSAGCDMSVPLL